MLESRNIVLALLTSWTLQQGLELISTPYTLKGNYSTWLLLQLRHHWPISLPPQTLAPSETLGIRPTHCWEQLVLGIHNFDIVFITTLAPSIKKQSMIFTATALSITVKNMVRNQLSEIMARIWSLFFRTSYNSGRCFAVSRSNTTTGHRNTYNVAVT